jgi:hypothetical protein
VESFFNGLASYFLVDIYMPMDLGDGNQLETGCGVVSAASQRSGFVVGLIASAYGMLNARTESAWVSAVEFLCRFCKSSDGASLTTGEHLVRI